MKTVTALLVGVVIGALGVMLWQHLSYRSANMSPQCEGLVRLSLQNGAIQPNPRNVCLHKGRRLFWEVEDVAFGDKVQIDFKQGEGPFAYVNGVQNPGKGHYVTEGKDQTATRSLKRIDSNLAETEGRWDYKVTWILANGRRIELDPVVCIRGGD